jgi:GTPase
LKQGQLRLPINGSIICYLGPDRGQYIPALVTSIQRQRLSVRNVKSGQAATLALKFHSDDFKNKPLKLDEGWQTSPPASFRLRRGQVLTESGTKPSSTLEFEAELHVLHHPSELAVGNQGTLHCGSLRQQVKVLSSKPLTTGNVGSVQFRFLTEPEYISVGQSILFHGPKRVKCIGKITKCL